jgi:hypothetical protein
MSTFLTHALVLTAALLPALAAHAATIGFEDVGAGLASESFYNGSDAAGGFSSGGADFSNTDFSNTFTDFGGGFSGWDGWAYSNTTDTTTPGFGNQYSAYTGGGAGGSDTYGVAFTAGSPSGGVSTITFATERVVLSGQFTNTTYPALSMLNGDAFAKQFGGESGDDPDFLLLSIIGIDALGGTTGTVDFYLADYRDSNNALDYIVDSWTTVDLSPLGEVAQLDFVLTGSDMGSFGLNTPSYFALDDLVVAPEPGTGLLLASGLVAIAIRRRGGRS